VRFVNISPPQVAVIALQLCLHFDLLYFLVQSCQITFHCNIVIFAVKFFAAKRNELSLYQNVSVLEALKTRNQIQVASEFGISQQYHRYSFVKVTLSRDGKKCHIESGPDMRGTPMW
jgi:hypothetical protein